MSDKNIETIIPEGQPLEDAAFPSFQHFQERGLTKREYFTALALNGLLVSQANYRPDLLAQAAVSLADSLLKKLAETEKK